MSRHHDRLDARRWTKARRQAFDRDGWRCNQCGKAGRLEAHHEPPLRDGADPYGVAGIRTLCRDCHIALHQPDNMTPGRAEWQAMVAEITERN